MADVQFTRNDADNIAKMAVRQEQTHEAVEKMSDTLTDFVVSADACHSEMKTAINKNTGFRTISTAVLKWALGIVTGSTILTVVAKALNII